MPLLNQANEPEVMVRQEAVLTLGAIGGDGVTSALLVALKNDPSPQVRWRAAMSLSWLGNNALVGELEQALAVEKDPQVREFLQDAITKVRDR
jgi:HEAT repeat protein